MDIVDILIAGAGQAGAQTAIALRQAGFAGSVLIVGEESDLPYERPPLSKAYLAGGMSPERLALRKESFWSERLISLLLDRRITAIAPEEHIATLSDGRLVRYGSLVWAAGGTPRGLTCPGGSLPGTHVVRTRAQVDRLRNEANAASRIVIIGGGYIGLETAAMFAKQGKQVSVIEAMPRLLARVAGDEISRFYLEQHRHHGVDVRLGLSVEAIDGDTRVRRVRLGDGAALDADVVVAGIGLIPNIDPLIAAGAAYSNGVNTDHFCRTSLPDVFAIGDCANQHNRFADEQRVRIESVQNAVDQGAHVAAMLTGASHRYDALPWFWSNQYDLKLQTAGLSAGHDLAVTRGDPGSASFSVVYLRAGRVIAIDSVNRMQDFTQGKSIVAAGARIAPDMLADIGRSLKDLAALVA
jgi:3-phenylpropionate/trans-cinnamate dioxygenase ferredoxin reductase component